MKSTPESCRYCKHWDIDKSKDKAGRVRSDRSACCLWELDRSKLPSCVYGYVYLPRQVMYGHEGKCCPCFAKREDGE